MHMLMVTIKMTVAIVMMTNLCIGKGRHET